MRLEPVRLQCQIQHYDWGGTDLIPNLIGHANPERKPCAELWIGAHAQAESLVEVRGEKVPLSLWIRRDPDGVLGPGAASRFAGQLPYLMKVLDVCRMLSIQVHPSAPQAQEGFDRENISGIACNAPNRNYRDNKPKPEVHVALTDFWLLHGFRPFDELARVVTDTPELRPLLPELEKASPHDEDRCRSALRDSYTRIVTAHQTDIDAALKPLVERLQAQGPEDKHSPDYWAARAARDYPLRDGHVDRGLVFIYLLNLLHLSPGQATYQGPGIVHAYLEGSNVELMGNSDNVLRVGLTNKHVDAEELLRCVVLCCEKPQIIEGAQISPTETTYGTDAREFELSRIRVTPGQPHTGEAGAGPHTLLATTGSGVLSSGNRALALRRGESVFVPYGLDYAIEAASEEVVLFKAAVPSIDSTK